MHMTMDCCSLRWFLVVFQFSCFWVVVGMLRFGQCQDVSFEFSGTNSFVAGLINCSEDCRFAENGSSATLPRGNRSRHEGGRLMYLTPIPLYNSSAGTVASFSTQFVFTILRERDEYGRYVPAADGFTFLIAPSPVVPLIPREGALGLFKQDLSSGDPDDGTTNLVAVEFDTYRSDYSPWDPGYAPHVGLDLNSLNSSAVSADKDPVVSNIIGNTMGVFINYSAAVRYLQVDMAIITPGQPPSAWSPRTVLTYSNFSLSAFVNEESYIGFSASTGGGRQLNTVTYWKFQTSFDKVVPFDEVVPVPAVPPSAPANLAGDGIETPSAPANPAGNGIETETSGAGPRKNGNVVVVIGLVVGAIGVVLLSLVARWWWKRSKSGRKDSRDSRGRPLAGGGGHLFQLPEAGYGPRSLKYNVLQKATKGFTTMLGEGGSGGVYLAVLPDGTRLAVKKIKEGSRDGEKQFLAEVSSIGQLSHKNLVPLTGWCQDQGELLLVYDYMPNGSLDNHLYGTGPAAAAAGLDWETRLNIVRGVAEAVAYLHQGWKQPVVHRDIKPSNVMLDEDLNAVLGDFGLAVFIDKHKMDQTVTRPAGTHGYLAPECLNTGKVGAESDLYSFGVLALEVVCGRRPIDWSRPPDEWILLSWVWSLHIEGRLPEAVDSRFRGAQGAMEVVLVGLLCCFPEPAARPKMSLVTQFLSGSIPVPEVPKEILPAAFQSFLSPEAENNLRMIQALNNASSSRPIKNKELLDLVPVEHTLQSWHSRSPEFFSADC